MTVLVAVLLLVGGFALAVLASARAVTHLGTLAATTSIPPFFIGVTLVAIGTDLPEMANSIVSSFTGHGDLNAGDSVGSVLTQATLVLGLLPLLAGSFEIDRLRVLIVALATIVGLGLGIFLMRDSYLSRGDGALFVGAWFLGSIAIVQHLTPAAEPLEAPQEHGRLFHGAAAFFYLALVAGGATAAVRALITLSETFGIAEYPLAFVVGALGTSLPELVVDLSAIRGGLKDMAIGDVLGSSFVDATLSIGIGPLLFPTAITGLASARGSAVVIAAIGIVALTMTLSKRLTRTKGAFLILVYLSAYAALLSGGISSPIEVIS